MTDLLHLGYISATLHNSWSTVFSRRSSVMLCLSFCCFICSYSPSYNYPLIVTAFIGIFYLLGSTFPYFLAPFWPIDKDWYYTDASCYCRSRIIASYLSLSCYLDFLSSETVCVNYLLDLSLSRKEFYSLVTFVKLSLSCYRSKIFCFSRYVRCVRSSAIWRLSYSTTFWFMNTVLSDRYFISQLL